MLTKKHFSKFAQILREVKEKHADHITNCPVYNEIKSRLIEYFSEENPLFNVEKFEKAIGGEKR